MPLARFSWSLALVLVAPLAWADEPAPPSDQPKVEVSEELRDLIRKLDADEFADRQTASDELAKKGKEAIPALEEAIRGDSFEARSRSFELLRRLFEKGDDASKAAAKSSLERLAKGNDGVARQAKQVLEPPNAEEPNAIPRIGGRIPIRPGAVPPVAIAVRKSVSISNNNGVKTIVVDDNGKKVKIVDDPAKGIEGEVTETKDGKEATEKFTAKNADELKEKHPDAHKYYEQYAKGDGFRVGAGGGFGGRLAPPAPTKEEVEARIKRLEDQIKALKDDPGTPAEVRTKRLEALERLRDRYKDEIKPLEKEAEKK